MQGKHKPSGSSRRDFIKGVAASTACLSTGAWAARADRSRVFGVSNCPVHDGQRRHLGIDALLSLLAEHSLPLYETATAHPWAGANGIVAANDIVLVKVNCQWKCRGATNTDVVRGLIHRLLQHPDGFTGEIVIIENGQGQGAFDGDPDGWGSYWEWPTIDNGVWVNAEDENLVTVDYLVNTVFASDPVSSYLLDTIRDTFITSGEHSTDGYRIIDPPVGSDTMTPVSYPCFTTAGGNRIELREGRWTGSAHASNVKLLNVPVLKHHEGTGITGALKHTFGILSMSDGHGGGVRHYSETGSQCGKMWSLVRAPDLNILDCIWVSHQSLSGYPPSETRRSDVLLAARDPVALDYVASKHVMLPLGGDLSGEHDPDTSSDLIAQLTQAQNFINANGGVAGHPARQGDAHVEIISPALTPRNSWIVY